MSNTHYQIMLLLFLILVVVYVSGCKLHEGIYERKFDHKDYTDKQAKYDFIYDNVDAAGATTDGDYTTIMKKIHEIERDILDFSVCNATTGGTSNKMDDYKLIHETRTGGKCTSALTKVKIQEKITALTTSIAAFNTKLGAAGSTVTDLEIAKILADFPVPGTNNPSLSSVYNGWSNPNDSTFSIPGAAGQLTVKTASSNSTDDVLSRNLSDAQIALRANIISKLSSKSNKIKTDRAQLDLKLMELNQLGNSQAGVNKMTMDSTVYASLIWSVLATSLIAYLVTTQ